MFGWFGNRAKPEPPPASASEWCLRNFDQAMTKTSRRRYVRRGSRDLTGWGRVIVVALGLAILAVGCAGVFR
jgi:hypothetical protein